MVWKTCQSCGNHERKDSDDSFCAFCEGGKMETKEEQSLRSLKVLVEKNRRAEAGKRIRRK